MDYLTTFPETSSVPLDPQIAADLRARDGVTPFYRMPPLEARAAYEAMAAAAPKLNDPITRVEDRAIPGAADDVAMRIYTPSGRSLFPTLLYLHGGGWVIGSPDAHDDLCRSLCHHTGADVVSVDYRRFYASFRYRAGSWDQTRRVVAKGEWHAGELFPRVAALTMRARCWLWRTLITESV
jgi:hypothetical protein